MIFGEKYFGIELKHMSEHSIDENELNQLLSNASLPTQSKANPIDLASKIRTDLANMSEVDKESLKDVSLTQAEVDQFEADFPSESSSGERAGTNVEVNP